MEEYLPIIVIVVLAVLGALLVLAGRSKGGLATALEPPQPTGAALQSVRHLPAVSFVNRDPVTEAIVLPPGIAFFPDTGRTAAHLTRHRLECDVTFEWFMDANTGDGREGHIAVQTRTTPAGLRTGDFRAVGWIAGSLWQGAERPPFDLGDFTRCAGIESWQNGANPPGWPWVKPESVLPGLRDACTYHVVFESAPLPGGGWSLRLRVGEKDTDIVLDDNPNVDPLEQAVAIAALGAGSVRFDNIISTWS